MPIISMFLGIIIYMRFNEHLPPHFLAKYQGQEAAFTLDGEILSGSIPPRQQKFVRAWIELHQDELAANWEVAREHGELFRIDPLR
ncbi:MAG: DUF4160 domain-containing protein [Synergistaceae bacterium]|nr:DUF4160 domain-containing protein [Synergistaceae bacterium]